jgi:D-amino peptidase
MVTGDEAACREAMALLGDGLTTVAVKRGLGRFSARHIAPLRARAMIEEGAAGAHATSEQVERYRHHAVVEIVDARTLVSRASDWWTAWRQFSFTFFRDL